MLADETDACQSPLALRWSGDMTIETAATRRAELLDALAESGEVIVRLEPARMDASILQLLISGQKSLAPSGRQLRVLVSSDTTRQQLVSAGFDFVSSDESM